MRRRSHRPSSLALLLLCALVLAAMLAYEAHDAVESHRATADRALRGYASVAAWDFAAGVVDELRESVGATFDPVTSTRAASTFELLPTMTFIERDARSTLRCESPRADADRFVFRLDYRDDRLDFAGREPPPELRDWLLRSLADRGSGYQAGWPFAVLVGDSPRSANREPVAIVYAVRYAEHRAPIAAYGFTTCASAVTSALFPRVLKRRPLLPPARAGVLSNDSLLIISITDRDGRALYESGQGVRTQYVETARVDQVGPMTIHATIRPAAAELLMLEAVPRSRVPTLVGLLLLTAAMIGLALTQLRHQAELARLRADFISSVSHELRTPLSQILLFAETLSLGRVRNEEERRNATEIIVSEGRRLMHLVENVLHFSRAERRMTRLTTCPVRVSEVVEETVNDWLPLSPRSVAMVIRDVDSTVVARADRSALRQMLLNLLENAAKYGPAGQTVRVGIGAYEDRARIWVEDEGAGIPANERHRVWEPFFRLPRDANSSVAGSGIGLFVVRELTRLQDGDAWVEDRPTNGGARFVIDLPLAVQPSPASQQISVTTLDS